MDVEGKLAATLTFSGSIDPELTVELGQLKTGKQVWKVQVTLYISCSTSERFETNRSLPGGSGRRRWGSGRKRDTSQISPEKGIASGEKLLSGKSGI